MTMKCKSCGGNIIDIIEYPRTVVTPFGVERPVSSTFVARCPNCLAESSKYLTKEDANTKGVREVFEEIKND